MWDRRQVTVICLTAIISVAAAVNYETIEFRVRSDTTESFTTEYNTEIRDDAGKETVIVKKNVIDALVANAKAREEDPTLITEPESRGAKLHGDLISIHDMKPGVDLEVRWADDEVLTLTDDITEVKSKDGTLTIEKTEDEDDGAVSVSFYILVSRPKRDDEAGGAGNGGD